MGSCVLQPWALGLRIRVTDFKGDIHLSEEEKAWTAHVAATDAASVPYWLLVSGGKFDYTIKWWDRDRYQQVVDLLPRPHSSSSRWGRPHIIIRRWMAPSIFAARRH